MSTFTSLWAHVYSYQATVAAGGHSPDFVLVNAQILRPDPYVGRLYCAPIILPCNTMLLGETATAVRACYGL
jgi:hypothetical protein